MRDLIKPGDTVEHEGSVVKVMWLYPGLAVDSRDRKAMVRDPAGDHVTVWYCNLRRMSCLWCGIGPLFHSFERNACRDCRVSLRGAVSVPDGAAGALTVAA